MTHYRNSYRGFTIVELLIVIVVIGVLAAVAIMGYTGMSMRAENTKTVTAVGQASSALRSYKTLNGEYPLINPTGSSLFDYLCIGDANTNCGQIGSAGSSIDCGGLSQATGRASFVESLGSVISKMPEPSSQLLECQGKQVRGIVYYVLGGSDKRAYMTFFLSGAQTCSGAGGSIMSEQRSFSGNTRCTVYLPA